MTTISHSQHKRIDEVIFEAFQTMSIVSSQNMVQSEAATRALLENIYINEYLKWVDHTYNDMEADKIHEIFKNVILNEKGEKTNDPNVSVIVNGLKEFNAERHAKFMIEMLTQLNVMTFNEDFIPPYKESELHKSVLAANSDLGVYSSMFVPSRSRATYAMSRNKPMIDAVTAALGEGIKEFTPAMYPLGEIKNMGFFKTLDEITTRIYGDAKDTPITKCNVPIIDIIVRIADSGSLDLNGNNVKEDKKEAAKKKAMSNAMTIVRFFMMIEDIFNQVGMIIREDKVESLKELQDECIPFKLAATATLETLGLHPDSFKEGCDHKNVGAIPKNIMYDDRNTFTKIIIESVILAEYFKIVKENKKCSPNLIQGLHFILVSKYPRLSIIHGLGLISKYIAYYNDFTYIDTVCGYFGLHVNEPTLPINYPDLYGMIYEEYFGRCYSISPRVTIDSKLSRKIWENNDVNVFKKQHFDNGFGGIIHTTSKTQNMLISKERFERLAKGYDICATYLAELPKFITKETSFEEILHCVLKATIGYPADFSKRNIYVERVNGKEKAFMKTFKRFRLEDIHVQDTQTAKSASSIGQSSEEPSMDYDNYFLLTSSGNRQLSYKYIPSPEEYRD